MLSLIREEKLNEMKGYITFQRMIRHREPRTVERYAGDLYRIRAKTGLSPDQIVEMARAGGELEIGDLKAKILEGNTRSMQYIINNDLNRLLKSNGVKELPEEEKNQYFPAEDHEPYTKDDIRRMLEWINTPKMKLYVHAAFESGLRIHHILTLKWKHVRDDYEKGKVPIFVKFTREEREKQKSAGYTFLGEGFARLLKECIENKSVKTEADTYLFESTSKNIKRKSPKGSPISYATVHDVLELARKKANVTGPKSANHAFRSYFSHALIKAEIPDPVRKRMLGHSLGSGDAYVTKDVEELRGYYLKSYAFINVESERIAPEALANWAGEKTVLVDQIKSLESQLRESQTARDTMERRLTRIEAVLSEWEGTSPESREKKKEKTETEKKEGPKYVAQSEDLDSLIKQLDESSPKRTRTK